MNKISECLFISSDDEEDSQEAFEMQYNYIYVEKVCGGNKIEISRILKDCENLELFELEPIQHIIDYKWETYAYSFFLNKFLLYVVFLICYYVDIERGLASSN